jgi:hypothetical protein
LVVGQVDGLVDPFDIRQRGNGPSRFARVVSLDKNSRSGDVGRCFIGLRFRRLLRPFSPRGRCFDNATEQNDEIAVMNNFILGLSVEQVSHKYRVARSQFVGGSQRIAKAITLEPNERAPQRLRLAWVFFDVRSHWADDRFHGHIAARGINFATQAAAGPGLPRIPNDIASGIDLDAPCVRGECVRQFTRDLQMCALLRKLRLLQMDLGNLRTQFRLINFLRGCRFLRFHIEEPL